MDGITEGWKMKTKEQGGLLPGENDSMPSDFDLKYGMRFINYIADVWDYVEKFKKVSEETVTEAPKVILTDDESEEVPLTSSSPPVQVSKPTCSVLIKYLNDTEEMYVGHNAWHEYRAMGYRWEKEERRRKEVRTTEGS